MSANKGLSVEMVAISMMGGVVVWMEKARMAKLEAVMKLPRGEWPQLLEVDGEMINPSRIEGIFSAGAMDEMQRRKNGQWLCRQGEWHDKFQKCECPDKSVLRKRCIEAAAQYREKGYWPRNAPSRAEIEQELGADWMTAQLPAK